MVKHLPPAIKQLLTLRGPSPPPSPSAHVLKGLFTRTLQDAKQHQAETGWLVLSTCTLLTLNRPTSVGHLYQYMTEQRVNDAVQNAAIMREAALKSTIFVGVPRVQSFLPIVYIRSSHLVFGQVILSLAALHEVLPDPVKSSLRSNSLRTPTPETVTEILKHGRKLWDSIYAPHADKLYAKLAGYHPDFIEFILNSYGTVLAPLPDNVEGNLSRTLGSVVGTACLRAEGGVGPQLTSHVFGLLKARHEPHKQTEEDKWLSSDEGTEWVIRMVDEIMDVVASDSNRQAKL